MNLTEIEEWIRENDPDIINVQETLCMKEVPISGYECTARRNPKTRGQAIYIKQGIKYHITDADKYSDTDMEIIGIEVKLKGRKSINVVNIYCRDRKIDVAKITKILNEYSDCIAIGDFNAKMENPLHDTTNENGVKLQEAYEDGRIKPITPDGYTRHDPSLRKPSIIDFMITKSKTKFTVTSVIVGHDVGSDHRPVTFSVSTHDIVAKVDQKMPTPNFDKADWETYQSYINQSVKTLPSIKSEKNSIDNAVAVFTELIQKADEANIPRKSNRNRTKPPLPRYIVDMIYEKRQLKNISQNRRLDINTRQDVKQKTNFLKRQINKQAKIFKRERLDVQWTETENKSPYGFYKLAKRMSEEKTYTKCTYPIKDQQGHHILEDEEKVEIFRNLYEDIYKIPEPDPDHQSTAYKRISEFTKTLTDDFATVCERDEQDFDIPVQVTPDDILKHLKYTKQSAPGPDKIYYMHIKRLPETALIYLAELYSNCLRCAYFPDLWKSGVTILLPKPGKDPSSAINYRPITLLSTLGKSLERIINDRLKTLIELHNLLPDSQAGFRPHRSTQDQLLRLIQNISSGFQRGNITLACFHDIEKAFDKMWTGGLLYKLNEISKLKRNTIGLLASFLQNRQVQFKVNGKTSLPLTLKAGTPQGAILSPTLFNLWVADIPQPGPTVNLSQFADDIAVWATGRSIDCAREKLQKYNDELASWCKRWMVLLSPLKTQLVCYSKKYPQSLACAYQYINGTRIDAITEAKFLGVTIDWQLKFRTQQKEILQRLKTKTARFSAITGSPKYPRASDATSLKILKSMIIPVSGYAHTVAAMFPDTYFKKLDILIMRATRKALHLPRTISREYVMEKSRLQTSKKRVMKNARNYVTNTTRSTNFQNFVANHKTSARLRKAHKTPLDIILHHE